MWPGVTNGKKKNQCLCCHGDDGSRRCFPTHSLETKQVQRATLVSRLGQHSDLGWGMEGEQRPRLPFVTRPHCPEPPLQITGSEDGPWASNAPSHWDQGLSGLPGPLALNLLTHSQRPRQAGAPGSVAIHPGRLEWGLQRAPT